MRTVSVFVAGAALTKCHRLGGLNSRHALLTVLEAGQKVKIKMLAELVAVESTLLGLQMALFVL